MKIELVASNGKFSSIVDISDKIFYILAYAGLPDY
jgi:hypothetical protein